MSVAYFHLVACGHSTAYLNVFGIVMTSPSERCSRHGVSGSQGVVKVYFPSCVPVLHLSGVRSRLPARDPSLFLAEGFSECRGLDPFGALKPLPILIPSNFFLNNGFPAVKALTPWQLETHFWGRNAWNYYSVARSFGALKGLTQNRRMFSFIFSQKSSLYTWAMGLFSRQ